MVARVVEGNVRLVLVAGLGGTGMEFAIESGSRRQRISDLVEEFLDGISLTRCHIHLVEVFGGLNFLPALLEDLTDDVAAGPQARKGIDALIVGLGGGF
jgi:NADH dehydrogenase FAD-containing subunit